MYKDAFKCSRYKVGRVCDCPAWLELLERNDKGEERITKDCSFKLMPRMMIEVIKASNRPAAAIESTRNEIVRGFQNLSATIALVGPQDGKALEHKRDVPPS